MDTTNIIHILYLHALQEVFNILKNQDNDIIVKTNKQ